MSNHKNSTATKQITMDGVKEIEIADVDLCPDMEPEDSETTPPTDTKPENLETMLSPDTELKIAQESNTIEVEPEPVTGVVINCFRLNVRIEPTIDSERICDVAAGSSIIIENSRSTEEWVGVFVPYKGRGYCMKKYIQISQ